MVGNDGEINVPTFSMFAKIGNAAMILDKDVRWQLFGALCDYGFYGQEAVLDDLDSQVRCVYLCVKEDIKNSITSRNEGKKGGRPPKRENTKPGVSENTKPGVSENTKPGVSENTKPGVSENAKPKPDQTKINQTRIVKRDRGASAPKRFSPPSSEEVETYCKDQGISIDATRFIDYYSAQGWKLSNGNAMKDWHAAARNWSRRDKLKQEERSIYADLF